MSKRGERQRGSNWFMVNTGEEDCLHCWVEEAKELIAKLKQAGYVYHRIGEDGVIPCGDDWPLKRTPGAVYLHKPGTGGNFVEKWPRPISDYEAVCLTCFPERAQPERAGECPRTPNTEHMAHERGKPCPPNRASKTCPTCQKQRNENSPCSNSFHLSDEGRASSLAATLEAWNGPTETTVITSALREGQGVGGGGTGDAMYVCKMCGGHAGLSGRSGTVWTNYGKFCSDDCRVEYLKTKNEEDFR